MNLLGKEEEDWSEVGVLVAEAKSILNSFACWPPNHVRRTTNQATHLLAKEAALSNTNYYDLEFVPHFIRHVVADKCLSMT